MGEAYEVVFSNDQTRKKILASASPLRAIGKPVEITGVTG
jgi:hypothetical protein